MSFDKKDNEEWYRDRIREHRMAAMTAKERGDTVGVVVENMLASSLERESKLQRTARM